MKIASLFAIVVAAAVVHNGIAQEVKDTLPTPPEGKTWKLVWHDEFDGKKLDTTKWDIPEYKRRDGYWSRKSISLDGKGHLVMSVLKDGDKFLDGCVRTKGKFEHSFGYYVARIRVAEAAWALVGLLDYGRWREQGRERGTGRDGNRHHGEAVAR